jgi:hypothetical protein
MKHLWVVFVLALLVASCGGPFDEPLSMTGQVGPTPTLACSLTGVLCAVDADCCSGVCLGACQ